VNGLPYIHIRPYTDEEWTWLPHVILTSDVDWDPTVLDHDLTSDTQWYDVLQDLHRPGKLLGRHFYSVIKTTKVLMITNFPDGAGTESIH
jgi:hypothetical protein